MHWPTSGARIDTRRLDRRVLWLAVLLTFVLGDLATTALGLGVSGVTEASPVAAGLIGMHGVAGLAGLKCLVVAGAFACWSVVPRPHRDGIPLGLTAVGAVATAWNLLVVAVAVYG
ncbi:MAG: hypothetical protein ABEJ89_01955 [Haloarculaceae archaeon]